MNGAGREATLVSLAGDGARIALEVCALTRRSPSRVDRMSDVEFLGEEFAQETGKSAEDLFRHLLSKS